MTADEVVSLKGKKTKEKNKINPLELLEDLCEHPRDDYLDMFKKHILHLSKPETNPVIGNLFAEMIYSSVKLIRESQEATNWWCDLFNGKGNADTPSFLVAYILEQKKCGVSLEKGEKC